MPGRWARIVPYASPDGDRWCWVDLATVTGHDGFVTAWAAAADARAHGYAIESDSDEFTYEPRPRDAHRPRGAV